MPIEDKGSNKGSEMMVPVQRESSTPHISVGSVDGICQVVNEESTDPDSSRINLEQSSSFLGLLPPQRKIEGTLGVQCVAQLFAELNVGFQHSEVLGGVHSDPAWTYGIGGSKSVVIDLKLDWTCPSDYKVVDLPAELQG